MILVLTAAFVALVGYALLRELRREDIALEQSVTGVVDIQGELLARGGADIVKTDRLALYLLDAAGGQVAALKFESPLVPPQNFRIGQADAVGGAPLTGTYYLVGITDKDGEVFRAVPGEAYGRTAEPVRLGAERVRLLLDQTYRGSLTNVPGGPTGMAAPGAPYGSQAQEEDPRRGIRGTVRASPALAASVAPGDRLIVLMFDPESGRPVATRILPITRFPQAFAISLPGGVEPKAAYSLRILTDKDNNPFGAAPGEIVGRSAQPVPLGTAGLDFVMDQPYTR